jgi:twinkle protein
MNMSQLDFEQFGIDVSHISRASRNGKTFCPQCHDTRHDKRDKSLSVNMETGAFKCHYCGWSGCAEVRTADDKQRWMEQQVWFTPKPIRRQKPEYKRPTPRQHQPMSAKALAWFNGRGISAETLQAMKVTEGMEWMPQKNGQANTVQFNYYRNGQLINTKFRTGDKCFKLCSGAELIPYNIDAIKGTKECIITEGEMDALTFYECGRHDVVSVPNGANANLDYLDDFIEEYFDNKETIYIAVDTDSKGVMLRDELLRRFGAERCRVVEYGDDCKDANEHLMAHGKDSLMSCLAAAPEVKMDGATDLGDFEPNLDSLFEHGLQRGVTIGHENLDKLISFETKRLCLVTGIPGSGKSEFIDEMAERLNMRYGWRFAYFSPENAPLEYHASKLIEKFTGKAFSQKTLSFGEYKQAKEHLYRNFFFITPNDDYKVSTILDIAKYFVRRRGIKCLVIDPFNRLDDESNGRNETQYISKVLDKLTNFAQVNDVLIILMAHPTKQRKTPTGGIEIPTLYDISGSAHFFNKADFGIVVHRDRNTDKVLVKVDKVKFRHLGECGTAYFKYNINNGRYVPYIEGFEPMWDNTNHLVDAERQKARDALEAAQLPLDSTDTTPDNDMPFAPSDGSPTPF